MYKIKCILTFLVGVDVSSLGITFKYQCRFLHKTANCDVKLFLNRPGRPLRAPEGWGSQNF